MTTRSQSVECQVADELRGVADELGRIASGDGNYLAQMDAALL